MYRFYVRFISFHLNLSLPVLSAIKWERQLSALEVVGDIVSIGDTAGLALEVHVFTGTNLE